MRVRRASRVDPGQRAPRVKVDVVLFGGAAELVTLDDPEEAPGRARNAFARLQPPPDHPEPATRAWRDLVAAEAAAVRVLPTPRTSPIPADAARACGEPAGGVREEALAAARESGDPELVGLVERILDEVGGAR